MQKSFQQWCPWEVKISKKRKSHPLLLLVPLFCVFSRNWPPWDVTQSTDTSPRLVRTLLPFNIQTEQQRKALSYNQAILIGCCEQECSACFHVEVFFFFCMGIFAIGCFTGDWNEIKVLIGVKYGSFKLSLWYLKSPLANLRYLLKDIYWALLQELIDLSSWKPPQMIKKSGRGSHCSKRKPHILFADIWASRDG